MACIKLKETYLRVHNLNSKDKNIFDLLERARDPTQPAFTYSKLTIETLEHGRHWRRSGIFIVNFEHISHLVLVFLLLTLSR